MAQIIKHLLAMQDTHPGSIPGWRRPPGEGNGNPLQYSCLEKPAWTVDPEGYNLQGHKETLLTIWQALGIWASLEAQTVKNLPAMHETQL